MPNSKSLRRALYVLAPTHPSFSWRSFAGRPRPQITNNTLLWTRNGKVGIGNALAGFATAFKESLLDDRALLVDSAILHKFCRLVPCRGLERLSSHVHPRSAARGAARRDTDPVVALAVGPSADVRTVGYSLVNFDNAHQVDSSSSSSGGGGGGRLSELGGRDSLSVPGMERFFEAAGCAARAAEEAGVRLSSVPLNGSASTSSSSLSSLPSSSLPLPSTSWPPSMCFYSAVLRSLVWGSERWRPLPSSSALPPPASPSLAPPPPPPPSTNGGDEFMLLGRYSEWLQSVYVGDPSRLLGAFEKALPGGGGGGAHAGEDAFSNKEVKEDDDGSSSSSISVFDAVVHLRTLSLLEDRTGENLRPADPGGSARAFIESSQFTQMVDCFASDIAFDAMRRRSEKWHSKARGEALASAGASTAKKGRQELAEQEEVVRVFVASDAGYGVKAAFARALSKELEGRLRSERSPRMPYMSSQQQQQQHRSGLPHAYAFVPASSFSWSAVLKKASANGSGARYGTDALSGPARGAEAAPLVTLEPLADPATVSAQDAIEAQQLNRGGASMMMMTNQRRSYKKAVQNFERALTHDPSRPDIWLNLGVALMELRRFTLARLVLEHALALHDHTTTTTTTTAAAPFALEDSSSSSRHNDNDGSSSGRLSHLPTQEGKSSALEASDVRGAAWAGGGGTSGRPEKTTTSGVSGLQQASKRLTAEEKQARAEMQFRSKLVAKLETAAARETADALRQQQQTQQQQTQQQPQQQEQRASPPSWPTAKSSSSSDGGSSDGGRSWSVSVEYFSDAMEPAHYMEWTHPILRSSSSSSATTSRHRGVPATVVAGGWALWPLNNHKAPRNSRKRGSTGGKATDEEVKLGSGEAGEAGQPTSPPPSPVRRTNKRDRSGGGGGGGEGEEEDEETWRRLAGTTAEWVLLSCGRRSLMAKGISGGSKLRPSSFALSAAAFGRTAHVAQLTSSSSSSSSPSQAQARGQCAWRSVASFGP